MADIFLKVDDGGLKISLNEVIKNIDKDLVEMRNKLPKTVGERLLELSRDLVPVYTGTLQASGKIKKGQYGEGVVLVYDATVGEQRRAQKEQFGMVRFGNEDDDPYASYAEITEERTQFMSKAIDVYNHNSKLQCTFSNMKQKVIIEVPVEIPKSLRHSEYIPLKKQFKAAKANFIIKGYEQRKKEYYGKDLYGIGARRYQYTINKRRKHYKKLYGANLIK